MGAIFDSSLALPKLNALQAFLHLSTWYLRASFTVAPGNGLAI
jgi:hypothetical protein